VPIQERRDAAAAKRFFGCLLVRHAGEARNVVSDKRRFKSMLQAQRFLGVHAAVSNLFNLGRHRVAADHYRELRRGAFASWDRAVAI
jgi:putative transposase